MPKLTTEIRIDLTKGTAAATMTKKTLTPLILMATLILTATMIWMIWLSMTNNSINLIIVINWKIIMPTTITINRAYLPNRKAEKSGRAPLENFNRLLQWVMPRVVRTNLLRI